jgi:predicted Zn-dependent peptidase
VHGMWWTLPIGCGPHLPVGVAPRVAAEAPVQVQRGEGPPDRARFQVEVAAGSALDPVGREGTAWVVADVVFRPLEGGGRELGWTTTVDGVEATLDCPADEAAACASALADALRAPSWSESALSLARTAAAAALATGDDTALATGALSLVVFRAHPYGHAPAGRTSVLATLAPSELQRFHGQRYTRPSLRVVVGGAVPDDTLETLRSDLRDVPPGADVLRPHGGDAPFPPLAACGSWLVVRPTDPASATVTLALGWTDDPAPELVTELIETELADAALVDTWEVTNADHPPLVRAVLTTTPDRVEAALQAAHTLPGAVSAVAVVDPDLAGALQRAEPHPVVLSAETLYR